MVLDLRGLAGFLVKAKRAGYAGGGKFVESGKPGFKEFGFVEGSWSYLDCYAGFFSAPGQEVVWFEAKPVWAMAYSGGMLPGFQKDREFAEKAFCFLKKALMQVSASKPFRGPELFQEKEWKYENKSTGSIEEFKGTECIHFKEKKVFKQEYNGGTIKGKET